LSTIYPGAAAAVWGVTPGENDRNRKRWERINPGDIALFSKKGKLFSVGEVSFKVHNKPLALDLWKVNTDAKTWEYVYFLKGIRQVDIPYAQFNAAAGYKPNNVIQSFEVLPEEKALSVFQSLNLGAVNYGLNQELISELANAAEKEGAFDIDDEEDGRKRALSSIVRRQGQPKFRQNLLDLYESKCAISGCDAVHALEAAHKVPYKGEKTNHASNGILLRSDLHTLFDLGLLTVDAETLAVKLGVLLKDTVYSALDGKPLRLPHDKQMWPNRGALAKHNSFSSGFAVKP
jgi:hypothetical protein